MRYKVFIGDFAGYHCRRCHTGFRRLTRKSLLDEQGVTRTRARRMVTGETNDQ